VDAGGGDGADEVAAKGQEATEGGRIRLFFVVPARPPTCLPASEEPATHVNVRGVRMICCLSPCAGDEAAAKTRGSSRVEGVQGAAEVDACIRRQPRRHRCSSTSTSSTSTSSPCPSGTASWIWTAAVPPSPWAVCPLFSGAWAAWAAWASADSPVAPALANLGVQQQQSQVWAKCACSWSRSRRRKSACGKHFSPRRARRRARLMNCRPFKHAYSRRWQRQPQTARSHAGRRSATSASQSSRRSRSARYRVVWCVRACVRAGGRAWRRNSQCTRAASPQQWRSLTSSAWCGGGGYTVAICRRVRKHARERVLCTPKQLSSYERSVTRYLSSSRRCVFAVAPSIVSPTKAFRATSKILTILCLVALMLPLPNSDDCAYRSIRAAHCVMFVIVDTAAAPFFVQRARVSAFGGTGDCGQ
jgi:hypothetical protein